ncbi:MAG: hypothetical protein ACOYN0_08840 [Phycisphaerales bacterium]
MAKKSQRSKPRSAPRATPKPKPRRTPELPEPRDRAELRAFVERYLGVRARDTPLLSGHAAPMDYLEHAFFGDRPGAPLPADGVLWANRGGGKTFLGAVATLLDLLFKPGITIRILGGSEHQSRFMLAHLRRLLDPAAHPEICEVARAETGSSRIVLANGSNAEVLSQAQTSVRGTRVQKLRCDEVDLFKPEIWDAVQLTTRSARCGGRDVVGVIECLSTMQNQGGMMSRVVSEAREGKRTLFRWGVLDVLESCPPTRECPECSLLSECQGRAKLVGPREGGHVTIADAVTLKSRVGEATWSAEMLCIEPRRSDAVYPEFSRSTHVVGREAMPEWVRACAAGTPMPGHRVIAGMDFGFANPTAVVWAVEDSEGTLWVFAEYERSEERLDDQAAMLAAGKRAPRPERIGVDPAGLARSHQTGVSSVHVLRESGLHIVTPRHALAAGINTVRALLTPAVGPRPKLFIDAGCRALIKCLEEYRNDEAGGPPIKSGADHLCDALRYMVMAIKSPEDRFESYLAAS